jgi:hypothetical protein
MATNDSDLDSDAGTRCMDTGWRTPAVLLLLEPTIGRPLKPPRPDDPPYASPPPAAFEIRSSSSCRFSISLAPSIPPTPACADDVPPGKAIAPNATSWAVGGGYILPRDTDSRYSLAEATESKTDARRGGAVDAAAAAATTPSFEPGPPPRSFGSGRREMSYEQITPFAPSVYRHDRPSSITMSTIGPASLALFSIAEPKIPEATPTIAPGTTDITIDGAGEEWLILRHLRDRDD